MHLLISFRLLYGPLTWKRKTLLSFLGHFNDLNYCGWGRKLFCNLIWWRAAQTSWKRIQKPQQRPAYTMQ